MVGGYIADIEEKQRLDRSSNWIGGIGGVLGGLGSISASSQYAAWPYIFATGTVLALWLVPGRSRQTWYWAAGAWLIAADVGLIIMNLARPLPGVPKWVAMFGLVALDAILSGLFLCGAKHVFRALTLENTPHNWRARTLLLAGSYFGVSIAGFLFWTLKGI